MKTDRFKDERERETLLIAYDYCVLGLRGERLAKHRHISTATLARRLQEAKKEGYISEAVFNVPSDALEGVYPYLYEVDLMEALQKHIGIENLPNLFIVPSASVEEKEKEPFINTERVGHAAAVRLLHHLEKKEMRTVGVSYGRTLRYMVNKVQESVISAEQREKPVKWVPIFGDFSLTPEIYFEYYGFQATILAADITRTLHGDAANRFFLTTPAYVPRDFMKGADEEEMERRRHMARKLVEAIPVHRKIFGVSDGSTERDPNALMAQIDTIITGMGGLSKSGEIGGSLGSPRAEGGADVLRFPGAIYTDEEREHLKKEGVVGDLCGPYITEDKVDGFPDHSIIERVNRRFLGATPKDFQRCAARAREENTPGVILVGDSASKARAVASAITNRCVTELICDSDLALELAKIKKIHIDAVGNGIR